MKILLALLIIANIVAAYYFHFIVHGSDESAVPLLYPEKIILLPVKE
ncbi:MAG: hypothetical protein RQ714_00510 [Nitrosomonas sp.]|nr:hypothetical protein [Nitrosomonas sp.]